jgi:hypothetical protein
VEVAEYGLAGSAYSYDQFLRRPSVFVTTMNVSRSQEYSVDISSGVP